MPAEFDEDRLRMVQGAAITDAAGAAGASPTSAEFNALVAKFNALLAVARDAGLIALD